MNGHDNLAGLRVQLCTVVLGQRPSHDICRGRFNADLWKEHASGLFGDSLVLLDHSRNIGNLSSHVKVVCAIFSASFEGLDKVSFAWIISLVDDTYMFAVEAVWADSGNQDEGLFRKCTQLLIVELACLNLCESGQPLREDIDILSIFPVRIVMEKCLKSSWA